MFLKKTVKCNLSLRSLFISDETEQNTNVGFDMVINFEISYGLMLDYLLLFGKLLEAQVG